MSLLLIAKNRDMNPLKEAILAIDPNLDIDLWPNVGNKERVTFAVSWNHPYNVLGNYPNLKVVSSLGAGVNHLIGDEGISDQTKITRIMVPSLKSGMADYVLNAVLNYRLHTAKYVDQKREGIWSNHDAVPLFDCTVGVMGLGEIGSVVVEKLLVNSLSVNGWSAAKKDMEGANCYALDQLDSFLAATNVLVCLLPLTPKTEGILELGVFKKLKKPAFVINVARGAHLVDEDLIYALDTGVLAGAALDVFSEEPLPPNHQFWNRSKIMITPHVASITDPIEAANVIVENYKRSLSGMELLFEVNRAKGY